MELAFRALQMFRNPDECFQRIRHADEGQAVRFEMESYDRSRGPRLLEPLGVAIVLGEGDVAGTGLGDGTGTCDLDLAVALESATHQIRQSLK